VQALQQFINQSPWTAEALRGGLARRFEARLPAGEPRYWVIDETSFPKAGTHSVGVARQYCGALGKLANCQGAVSLHVSDRALERSQPLGWRLFLPHEWVGDPVPPRQSRCAHDGGRAEQACCPGVGPH
jgi:SRSO17 transposase